MKQNFSFLGLTKTLLFLSFIIALAVPAKAQTIVNVSGTVFNDVNRNTRIDAGESLSSLPVPLYVYLVRANVIRAVATVANDGTYTLSATTGFTYTLELSTQSYPNGTNVTTTPINHNPPNGWATTGENASGTNTGSGDFLPDGIMQVTVTSTALVARNFGITCKRAGTSNSTDICTNESSLMPLADFLNDEDAGGTWSYQSGSGITFDPGAATIQLAANPTTSTYQYNIVGAGGCPSSSSIVTVVIRPRAYGSQNLSICAGDSVCVTNPGGGSSRTLYFDENVCYTTAGTYIDTLKFASQYGCDSILTTTVTVNNCGTVNISGSVFNDLNGNKIVDASENFSSLPATMYVYLVNSNNIVVGIATVAANGSYTIQGSPNQSYTLKLSTQQYPLGTKVANNPISTTPPSGWTTTGENGNNNTGSGDGTPDGSLPLTLGTSSVNNQNFGIASSSPLAVNLLSFKAAESSTGVQLSWTTASERNNKGFAIERSADGNSWTKIGFVNSQAIQGNSNVQLGYSFMDKAAAQGKNFYRLQQLDVNGSSTYSSIEMVTYTKDNTLAVYPNPAKEVLIVEGLQSTAVLSIRNTLGQELSMKAVVANGAPVRLDIAHLTAGVYCIVILDEHQNVINKQLFIKQ